MSFYPCLRDKTKVWPFKSCKCNTCDKDMKDKCYDFRIKARERELKSGNIS